MRWKKQEPGRECEEADHMQRIEAKSEENEEKVQLLLQKQINELYAISNVCIDGRNEEKLGKHVNRTG